MMMWSWLWSAYVGELTQQAFNVNSLIHFPRYFRKHFHYFTHPSHEFCFTFNLKTFCTAIYISNSPPTHNAYTRCLSYCEQYFATNDDVWDKIINLDRHGREKQTSLEEEGELLFYFAAFCFTGFVEKSRKIFFLTLKDMSAGGGRENNLSNCVLSCFGSKQIYLRKCMLMENSTRDPQNIPGNSSMSNKYLCLYFVWNLWSNKRKTHYLILMILIANTSLGWMLCATHKRGEYTGVN